jgi:hypothetical protein
MCHVPPADACSPNIVAQNPRAQTAVIGCSHTLPNVGNEGHTYLHHIVQHWDTLPDLLILLPDTVEYGDKLKTWRRVKVRAVPFTPPPPAYHCDSRVIHARRGNRATWSATGVASTTRMTTRL